MAQEICKHYEQRLIREQNWSYKGHRYTLEVSRCTKCGETLYGYDGWTRDDWQSLADVKEHIKNPRLKK